MAIQKRARPAASVGAAKAKKAKTDAKAVAKAVLSAEDLRKDVRSMLSTAAPYALAEYSDARTSHQAEVVTMVGSALAGMQASLEKAIDEASGKVAGQSQEKTTRDAAVFQAAKGIAAKKGEAAKKEYDELEATFYFKKADEALKVAAKEAKAGDKGYDAIQAKIEQLEAVKGKVETMKAGACPRKDVAQLEKDMKPFHIDPTLVQSMHLCLIKEPADLSEFEKTMMGKLDVELNESMEALNKQLAAEQPAKDARAATLEAAKAAQGAAKEKLDQSKAALSGARADVTEAKKQLTEAEGKVASYDADMQKQEAELQAAQDELDVFKSGPLSAFQELKSHTTPPPEPEPEEPVPAAAESAAAMAEAAA